MTRLWKSNATNYTLLYFTLLQPIHCKSVSPLLVFHSSAAHSRHQSPAVPHPDNESALVTTEEAHSLHDSLSSSRLTCHVSFASCCIIMLEGSHWMPCPTLFPLPRHASTVDTKQVGWTCGWFMLFLSLSDSLCRNPDSSDQVAFYSLQLFSFPVPG